MKLVFKKICSGLYFNHEYKMSISHEAVWNVSEGRKWVAKWQMRGVMGIGTPYDREQKFNTMAEARSFLNSLVNS